MFNFNNFNRQLKSLLLCGSCLLASYSLVACSTYQKHFGGKGHEYNNAVSHTPLKFTNSKVRIEKSSRYFIPNVPSSSQESVDYTTPPDYLPKE
jgi:hypothetical protein